MERSNPGGRGALHHPRPSEGGAEFVRRCGHGRGVRRRVFAAQLILGVSLALTPSIARADEVDDLILGRDSYTNGEYDAALDHLRPLVELESPTPRVAALVTAARRYYAACLYAQHHEDLARATLARMLREDPDARLDPTQYDPRFMRYFELLLREMQPELDRLRTARAIAGRQAEDRRAAREAFLREILTHESQIERVPREFMWVPFGVGQFVNGQRGLGIFFLVSELLLTATVITTYTLHASLFPPGTQFSATDATGATDVEAIARYNESLALLYTNWASAGLLVAAGITGVVLANTSWQPIRQRSTVPRPIPPELQNLRLMAGPSPDGTGLGATLRLTF